MSTVCDTRLDLVLTTQSRALSVPRRVGAVLPIPALVIGTIAGQVGLMAAYMQAGLVATGQQVAASAVGRVVATAMLVGATYLLTAVAIAAVRVLAEMVLEHIRQRRFEAQRVVIEIDRYREQEQKLRALADEMQRERNGSSLPVAI